MMCWRMCLYGCFVLGIVRTWEVVSVLRKVPRNLGSGVGKVPRFRYAFVWRSSEGVRGNLRAGPTGIRCDALAIRRLGLLRTKTKKLRGAHTGNDTMGAAPVPASPSPSTRDEVARSESLPEPYRGPRHAIVAPQVRPPARPARENGGFPTPPQEKDRREE